jgi:hypothetical protein
MSYILPVIRIVRFSAVDAVRLAEVDSGRESDAGGQT